MTRPYVPADVREANLAGLARFVAAVKVDARLKGPNAAREYIMAQAKFLNDQMAELGGRNTPPRLRGLTAFDLANARDELVTAAPKQRRA